ncbi:hypothetical protein [Streptomyces cucumeris]|uniref:hypothetical protein n=1 Tax=Streptomyces cucumeris TaxID=2962890 RepID=UPI0020C8B1AB|nr:hypothetical protein [Streptomyces sp. NEAU-Y11]MCP9209665.1 hypothetical protein [Streptomyces sp. NEAU-Y11]
MGTPEAEEAGLVRHPDGNLPHGGRHVFLKAAHEVGVYNPGDFVIPHDFRLAAAMVLEVRGNYGEIGAVADAYWDLLKREPGEWSSATVVTLATLAPFLGIQDSLAND